MSKLLSIVVYKSKADASQHLHVANPKNLDYPISVTVAGVEYGFVRELQQEGKVKSGDSYFRSMSMFERVKVAELMVKSQIDKAIQNGDITIPDEGKRSMQIFDQKITNLIRKHGAKEAQRLKGRVVVDVW